MYLEWLNLQALMTAWRLPHNCMKAAWQLPYDCLTTADFSLTKTEEKITYFFLVAGFPVPYIGILTEKGSFSSTLSPILDYKYHKNVITLNELPTPGFAECVELANSQYLLPELLPYYENNKIIFLYPNAKNLAVKYSINQRSHRKIQKSILPMGYRFEISNTRLGNHIWIMGGPFCDGINAFHTTMLWSMKKEKWFFGPKMPQEYSQSQSGCQSQSIKDPVYSLHYHLPRINN